VRSGAGSELLFFVFVLLSGILDVDDADAC
jgi:hypothetical protein